MKFLIKYLKGDKKRDDTLKIIGMSSMLVDHIGLVFFPGVVWLRIIGRLALPVFTYSVAQGYHYTSDIKKYIGRLLIFGLASQVPFMLLFEVYKLNILFTLALSLIMIWLIEKRYYLISFALALFVMIGFFEYGIYGVLMTVLFYIFKNKKFKCFVSQTVSTFIYYISTLAWPQLYALFGIALVLWLPTKNKLISLNKNIFYWFYPIHLSILLLIKLILI